LPPPLWDHARPLNDVDVAQALAWFHGAPNGFTALKLGMLRDAMIAAAHDNTYHDVRAFFAKLIAQDDPNEAPETIPRTLNPDLPTPDALSMLLIKGFGAEDTALNRAIGRAFVIAMVRRVRTPGCQHDHMPVLIGEQGVGKSSGVRELIGPQWLADHVPDMASKDACIQLHGKLCIEIAELVAIARARIETVKAYLSRPKDTFRPPYERNTRDVPRTCVFVGTTNDEQFIDDPSGARRFWPVAVGLVDRDWIRNNRGLIWRLACEAEANNEPIWIIDPSLQHEVGERQSRIQEADPWTEPVLARATPGFIVNAAFVGQALSLDFKAMDAKTISRITGILRKAGWRRGPQERIDGDRARRWYPDGDLSV
jgi:predicted P-loop ATPase